MEVQSTTESDDGSTSASIDDYVPDATKILSSLQLPHDTHKSQGELLLDLIEESSGNEIRQEIEKFASDTRSDKEKDPRCEPAQQLVVDFDRVFNEEEDEGGNKGPNEDPNKEEEPDQEIHEEAVEDNWSSHDTDVDLLWQSFIDEIRLLQGELDTATLCRPSGPLRGVLTCIWN
ncbi:hypothetical protein LIA77_08767 [Sarocladium implicatum]|nr:hypothetical protein LIA77_08767 [Sarocladium implicatum]